jgi:adenylate cyclase
MGSMLRKEIEVPSLPPEEVREHLRTLLARKEFNVSERNRRFLSYVVEETLAGRADRIKAYNIALAAFDRGEDFDPLNDPIVRIEAGRLRRALEHHYLTEGRTDRLRISIPKGSYAANFAYADADPVTPVESPPGAEAQDAPADRPIVHAPRPSWKVRASMAAGLLFLVCVGAGLGYWGNSVRDHLSPPPARGLTLIVLPFEDLGTDSSRSFVARGMTYEIIANLARYRDISVVGPETSFAIGAAGGLQQLSAALRPDFVLSGSVQSDRSTIHISTILSDARTSRSIWSWSAERQLTTQSIGSLQDVIAGEVADAIGRPYGIVFDRTAEIIASKSTAHLTSYECVVKFRLYWRHYNEREHSDTRDCLERTIENDPGYGQAYASLALVYVDSTRFGFGRSEIDFDPLPRALDLARKAMELEPQSADSHLALSSAYWFAGEVDKSLQIAERGLEINPGSSDLQADLGYHHVLLGEWEKGMPLVSAAYERDPAAPTGYRLATFLYALMHGDYPTALDAALKVEAPFVLYGHFARAVAYAKLGKDADAAREYAELIKIDPKYRAYAAADLAKRNLNPEIIRVLVQGLDLAAAAHAKQQASN